MTNLETRILALFRPDGSTGLTGPEITRSLRLGDQSPPKCLHRLLKSLIRTGKLIAETDFGNPGTVYWLPKTSEILTAGQGCNSQQADEQIKIINQATNHFGFEDNSAAYAQYPAIAWYPPGPQSSWSPEQKKMVSDAQCARLAAVGKLKEIAPFQAVLASRRTPLIDEAVRRTKACGKWNVWAIHTDLIEGVVSIETIADRWQNTISAIRSEFRKLVEERS